MFTIDKYLLLNNIVYITKLFINKNININIKSIAKIKN